METNAPPPSSTVAVQLPTSTVLSYVTATTTPTRVRRVAAIGVLVFAVLYLLPAGWAGFMFYDNFDRYEYVYSSIKSYGLRVALTHYWVRDYLIEALMLIGLALLSLLAAVMLACCIMGVRRGKCFSCRLAVVATTPVLLAVTLAAAVIGGWGVLEGFGLWSTQARPLSFLLLLVTLLLVPVIALMYDVITYLRWIARNPLMEKPPVPFIPPARGTS